MHGSTGCAASYALGFEQGAWAGAFAALMAVLLLAVVVGQVREFSARLRGRAERHA